MLHVENSKRRKRREQRAIMYESVYLPAGMYAPEAGNQCPDRREIVMACCN